MAGHRAEPGKQHDTKAETPGQDELLRDLNQQVVALTKELHWMRKLLEKLRLQQYVQALLNVRRIAWVSFFMGILNGLGAAIGATLVLALLLYILSRLEVLPHIGRFVSEIVKIVQQQKP